ncbi:MAG: aminoacetone oxidase family FAD-binding enzyme [Chlorobium sp.]|nr:MAG: aminoacetone oxidase family FAD-binding enzyme [Chlorobium sp.]
MNQCKTTVIHTNGSECGNRSVVVIGGGASGMLAAIACRKAAERTKKGCSIVLLERNVHPGSKIKISGGGKCNVTHQGTPDELLRIGFLRQKEQRFLRHAFYSFTSNNLVELLFRGGVLTFQRDDGKVFPVNGNGLSVVLLLEKLLRESAVNSFFSNRVLSVEQHKGQFLVTTNRSSFIADVVIVATGGVSYSRTGTTGDGLQIARAFGHSFKDTSPALAPVYTKKPFPLAGVSLCSIDFLAQAGDDRSVVRRGDLLFTHHGFSGPVVLSLSRDIAELRAIYANILLFADLFPELTKVELEEKLLTQARKSGTQMVRKYLQGTHTGINNKIVGIIPSPLVPYLMSQASLDNDVTWSGLLREKRQLLLHALKHFPLGNVLDVPLDQGEISAGGVLLDEVNPKTMESRLVPNLFFCGELLDYAGEIGGYNLQAAFSTGWLAGSNAI